MGIVKDVELSHWVRFCCVFLISFISFGCALTAPAKLYEGEQLMRDQVSVLNISSQNVRLREIDSQPIKTLKRHKFQILPGEHTLKFTYGGKPFSQPKVIEMSFNAEAGQVYIVYDAVLHDVKIRNIKELFLKQHKIYLWIEKNKSREVVGGYYPGKPDFWGYYENVDPEKGYVW